MLNDLKAEFSTAYVRAIAHAAGFFTQDAGRLMDADGVDLQVFSRGAGGVIRSPRLDLQLKATKTPVTEDPFPFDLDVKNYDELRDERLQVPRILVVVVVPADIAHWVSTTEQELTLRHCGYWVSLRGRPATANDETIRIRIPRASCFHVDPVRAIMGRIEEGGLP